MTFLHPWIALLAGAVAIPLLLVLYLLKLRRRRLATASTLLWHGSFEDLQVNAPFQRLRVSSLFLLQLALIILLLIAAAEPVIEPSGPSASEAILIIDQSASMNATDAPRAGVSAGLPRSRLDAARAAARQIVDRLTRVSGDGAVMVIAMGARGRIVSGFDARRDVLFDAIDSIRPTDEEADLAAALQLAGTFASRGEADREAPDVILVSDGGVRPPVDPGGFTLRAGRVRFVAVGPEGEGGGGPAPAARNLGIVSLSARRDYTDPTQVLVFARLVNTGPEPLDTLVSLFVDEAAGPIKRLTIDAAGGGGTAAAAAGREPDGQEHRPPPGQATVTFTIDLPAAAVLRVRHSTRDPLPADDTAAVVLPAPARPRIALVHGDGAPDPFLHRLLAESEPRELRTMTLEVYERFDPLEIDLGRRFDLVVFDAAAPSRLPGIPTMTFGALPPGVEAIGAGAEDGRRILSWQRRHPIMRHVSLDTIAFAGFGGFRLPDGATALATGPAGPVIALLPGGGARHIAVGFSLARSNWPAHVSVAVFLQNALDFLTLGRSGQASKVSRPGEVVTGQADGDARGLVITGPGLPEGGARVDVPGGAGARVTLPVLRRVGLYIVEGALPPLDRVAVSMLSEVESDIRPRSTLIVNAEAVHAGAAAAAAPRGVWHWFAAGALLFLVLEWIAYCRLLRM